MTNSKKLRSDFKKNSGINAISSYKGVYRATEEYTEWLENLVIKLDGCLLLALKDSKK